MAETTELIFVDDRLVFIEMTFSESMDSLGIFKKRLTEIYGVKPIQKFESFLLTNNIYHRWYGYDVRVQLNSPEINKSKDIETIKSVFGEDYSYITRPYISCYYWKEMDFVNKKKSTESKRRSTNRNNTREKNERKRFQKDF